MKENRTKISLLLLLVGVAILLNFCGNRNSSNSSRSSKTPKTVRIQARGVTRGGEVLAKPRVAPVDRKKRS